VTFTAGLLLGVLLALGPAIWLYYVVMKLLNQLTLPRGHVPSGVQIKRPGVKRKPIVVDDRTAWEREQEKN
jgi:hypothetical protein